MKRIDFIDSLRGLAILLVILFHVFSRWKHVVPYGDTYANFPIFKYGFMGVLLFFLISGFVILMTLEKTGSYLHFLYKRWLRLFPAMLIASILIYLSLFLLPERPSKTTGLLSLLPGLLFIDIYWIKLFTGIKVMYIEGAFWSLIVEFKLYLVFGMLFYWLGKSRAILITASLHLIWIVSDITNDEYTTFISDFLSLQFYGWFACGAWAYMFYTERQKKYLFYSCIIGLINLMQYRDNYVAMIWVVIMLLLFLLPVNFKKVRTAFTNRFLLFLGFISYPLYLIHENITIGLTIKFSKEFSAVPPEIFALLSLLIVGTIAYLITKFLEPLVRKLVTVKLTVKKNASMENE